MDKEKRRLVDAIADAHRTGQLLPLMAPGEAPADVAEAYEMQEAVTAACGFTPGGWKLGCTSEVSQRNLGSEGPVAGRMLAARIFASGAVLTDVRMDMLIVEAEFAFRLIADLPPRGQDYSEAEVSQAIGPLYPAIELVQSRFAGLRMPILDIIADNAGAGSLILGEPVDDWHDLDLAGQAVSLRGPDGIIASGHGRDVLGHPINAMVWLANSLNHRGLGLKAGEIVTTGTCFAPPKLQADISVTADFGMLGVCHVRFQQAAAS